MMEDQCDIAYHMPFLEECASRASVIVEIGVGHGNGSTRAFARGLARSTHFGKLHIGVDIDPERPQEKPGYPYWHEVHGPSEQILIAFMVGNLIVDGGRQPDRRPDIIFIDTDHNYEQMQKELEAWSPLAGPNTLWIFHDTWMSGEYNHMTDAIKEFAQANCWTFIDHSREAHGLGLMRA